MDRTLIAWNVPNLITIPLMAFLAFLVVGVVYQFAMRAKGGSQTSSTAAGF
jgi:hypothetical protein